MLVTVILCSVQRKPVANIEAIPTPRRPVPVKRRAEDEAPRTERSSEDRRERQIEAHITRLGLAIWDQRYVRITDFVTIMLPWPEEWPTHV